MRNSGRGGAELLGTPLGAVETWVAAIALAGLIAMRVVYAFMYRVDSDEPQHLHVVWGWAHGLLPYRDLFDNHSPLFQMLCAPLFWALGEHAWIVVPMRLAMLPLFLADLYLVYLIGRTLYGQRWGVWMAIVAGCMPAFFLVTTEFRTDDLWTTLWLAAVYLAVSGPMAGRRAFLFGLTMGACFSVSMKTSLLLISLAVAGLGLLTLHALSRRHRDAGAAVRNAGFILAGLLIIPGLLVGFFALKGALPQMYYCVVVHNSVPGLGKWAKAGFHEWLFPLSLPALLGLGWLCMHSSADERIGAGRALILMACGVYYFLLRSYWPLVTAQDFIPILPLAAVCVLAFLFHLLSLTGWPARVVIPVTGLVLLAGSMVWVCRLQSPLDNEMAGFEQNLAIVLHLTNPDDLVMDGKGETIFRNRPIYWVLEGITIKRIALGLIPDDVQARIIQTGTCVAVNHRLRPEDQGWLRANFIEGDGKVWVAGEKLGAAHPTMNFHTDIKGKYSIVADGGKVDGTLDGAPLQDSQQIPAGDHQLKIASGSGEVAVIWSQALQRGFNPFTKRIAGFTAD
jgi:hypothetical protein